MVERPNKTQLTNVDQDKKLIHKATASGVMTISPRVPMVCHVLDQTAHTDKSLCSMVPAQHAQCSTLLMRVRLSVSSQTAQMAGRLVRKENVLSVSHILEVCQVTLDVIDQLVDHIPFSERMVTVTNQYALKTNISTGEVIAKTAHHIKLLSVRKLVKLQHVL